VISLNISAGRTLAILTEESCGFPQSLQGNSRTVPQLGKDFFLPNLFNTHAHQSPYYLTLYAFDTESSIKITQKRYISRTAVTVLIKLGHSIWLQPVMGRSQSLIRQGLIILTPKRYAPYQESDDGKRRVTVRKSSVSLFLGFI
jgi:hypothetical protein